MRAVSEAPQPDTGAGVQPAAFEHGQLERALFRLQVQPQGGGTGLAGVFRGPEQESALAAISGAQMRLDAVRLIVKGDLE